MKFSQTEFNKLVDAYRDALFVYWNARLNYRDCPDKEAQLMWKKMREAEDLVWIADEAIGNYVMASLSAPAPVT